MFTTGCKESKGWLLGSRSFCSFSPFGATPYLDKMLGNAQKGGTAEKDFTALTNPRCGL